MSAPRPRIDPLPGPSRRGLLVLAALPTAASARTIVPAPSAHATTIAVAPVERTAPTVSVPTAEMCIRDSAWSCFILIFVLLLLTSKLVPAVNAWLAQFSSAVTIYSLSLIHI